MFPRLQRHYTNSLLYDLSESKCLLPSAAWAKPTDVDTIVTIHQPRLKVLKFHNCWPPTVIRQHLSCVATYRLVPSGANRSLQECAKSTPQQKLTTFSISGAIRNRISARSIAEQYIVFSPVLSTQQAVGLAAHYGIVDMVGAFCRSWRTQIGYLCVIMPCFLFAHSDWVRKLCFHSPWVHTHSNTQERLSGDCGFILHSTWRKMQMIWRNERGRKFV